MSSWIQLVGTRLPAHNGAMVGPCPGCGSINGCLIARGHAAVRFDPRIR